MPPETIHIASATDDGYLPHVAALIESVASSNSPDAVTLHVAHDASVSAGDRDRLRQICDKHGLRLEFLQPPAEFADRLPAVLRGTRYPGVIWFRIWLAELLPSLDRVLYLDGDTLVLQDLRPLWNTDLMGRLLGAVRADVHGDVRPGSLHERAAHGIFNSGVLLMDLERMRNERFAQHLLEVGLTLTAEPEYPDQDALNLACGDSWLPLHPKWNVLGSLYLDRDLGRFGYSTIELREAMTSPAILHFAGPMIFRPWNVRCVHPHRELYREYRLRTPWPLLDLEGSRVFKHRTLSKLPIEWQLALKRVRHQLTSRISRQGGRT